MGYRLPSLEIISELLPHVTQLSGPLRVHICHDAATLCVEMRRLMLVGLVAWLW